MQEHNTWILEITYQDKYPPPSTSSYKDSRLRQKVHRSFSETGQLNMSLYEKEQVSPLKSISTIPVDFSRIEYLVNEIIAIINKADRRKMLSDDSIKELKKNARLLYDLLLTRQVKTRLSSLGSVNLILSLDERLISIPWELLFDSKDFLCLKFNLGRSIHTQSPEIQFQYRSIPERPRMLILSNPTGDLKSAYQEGLYIKNYLTKRDKISVDFKAQDIDSNYVRKNLRDYDIIHFAGHCEYDSKNPQESGWLLSDGWVSAKEFLALGENASFPSIVFVNACQSARTNSSILDSQIQNNVYNLAQAFLFAGARHYLGSFWRIEDNFSWEFAEQFYSQIANAKSIGEAVRLARLKLFRNHGIAAIAWAGYVLYGDPTFVLFRAASVPTGSAKSKVSTIRSTFDFFRWTHRHNQVKAPLSFIAKKKVVALGLVLVIIVIGLALTKILPTFNPNTYLLFSKAKQLYDKGDNSKVMDLVSAIIEQDSLYLPAWRLRGDIYFRLGKFLDALGDYFDYARFSERKKDYKHLATAYIKIAWIYHMWGDYPKSEEFYQKALKLSRKYQDKLNEADAMARLAVWYVDKGNNEAAFSLLMKSSEINRQRNRDPEHRFNLACDYFNIAFLYVEKGDYPIAKELFEKSKQIFESLGAIPELSDYYFNMGEVALFEKEYDLALEFYQKGLALDKQLDHRFNLSSDYWMLGEFYWGIGKFTEAENHFKEAIFICQEINNRPVLAGVYYDLGLMYKEMGERQKAKEHLSRALAIYKDIDTPDYQEVQQEYLALE